MDVGDSKVYKDEGEFSDATKRTEDDYVKEQEENPDVKNAMKKGDHPLTEKETEFYKAMNDIGSSGSLPCGKYYQNTDYLSISIDDSVSVVPSLAGIQGTVSKLTVTAYNQLYTALADATATIGSGDANKTLTIKGKTNNNGSLSESSATVSLTLPASFVGASVGATTVRAGHNGTDFSALSWVISK